MKKKLIEQHPWMREGKKTTRKQKYFCEAYILDDEMLFIDCYQLMLKKYERCFRVVLTDKDHITYMADGSFSTATIQKIIGIEIYGWYKRTAAGILKDYSMSKDDEELAREWITDRYRTYLSNQHIFRLIEDYQSNIGWNKRETAKDRRYRKLQKKARELPDLPKDFKRYLEQKVYRDKHILYYSDDKAFCSRCGRNLDPDRKYKHNIIGSCPKCRRRVVYKSLNKMKEHEDRAEILIVQEFKNEIVFRYVKTMLIQDGEHKERIEFTESVRTYHDEYLRYKSKLIQYYDNMFGREFWSDRNSYYSQVVYGKNTMLYLGNMDELRTIFCKEWLDMMEYWANEGIGMPIISFIEMSDHRRQVLEKLFKAGLYKLSKEYVKGNMYGLATSESELKKILKLSKPLMNWAQKEDINLQQFNTLRDAYEGQYGLSDEEIIELAKSKVGINILKDVTVNRKIMKTFHYLKKAAGYSDINDKLRHYRDYLSMANSMNYDLNNDVKRYPKDIKEAHDKATIEFNKVEADIKKQEAIKKYPMISKYCMHLNEFYGFKDKAYTILAPESAGDIIEEGRVLHHCVGGDGYLNKHNTQKSFILFLRKVDNPSERYYTIEIDSKDQRIIQYYGAHDQKPDKDSVDAFLEKWKKHIVREVKNGNSCISELCAV